MVGGVNEKLGGAMGAGTGFARVGMMVCPRVVGVAGTRCHWHSQSE